MTEKKSKRHCSVKPTAREGDRGRKAPVTCADILQATGGELVVGNAAAPFLGLSTDSRTLKKGEVFLALKGTRFNGHVFVKEALARGAAGAIMEREHIECSLTAVFKSKPLIAVPDGLRALGDIARFWRKKFSIPLIGLTGSNGKTSTKEMIAFLLEDQFNVLKNPGNFNNLVGLPLTLLDLNASHQVAVVEMGTNTPGEIRRLAEIAQPTVGLITNIGQAHLEGMGSLENVVKEKGALFRGVGRNGVLAVNKNDPEILRLAADMRTRKILYGINTEADVRIDQIRLLGGRGSHFRLSTGGKHIWVEFPLLGHPFVWSAAAAAAVAWLFEINIESIGKRLERVRPLSMRMEMVSLRGATFINDAYNANPQSVEMALKTLHETAGKARIFAVLGDMLELGAESRTAHRRVGRLLGKLNLAGAFLLGDHGHDVVQGAIATGMSSRNLWISQNHRDIASRLRDMIVPGDWVLVKGSRRMQMETVIDMVKEGA